MNAPLRLETKRYFAALGARITSWRKVRGFTQAELAAAIGVTQQAVLAYECGDRRVTVLLLERIARAFAIFLEELVGISKPVRLRSWRISPRAIRHGERLLALSKTQQRFVVRIIDVLQDSNCRRECAR